jgi:hypothetical protein
VAAGFGSEFNNVALALNKARLLGLQLVIDGEDWHYRCDNREHRRQYDTHACCYAGATRRTRGIAISSHRTTAN